MDVAVLRAMRDELEKIARFNPTSGKFIPEVGEKLLNVVRGASKPAQASRVTAGGKFLAWVSALFPRAADAMMEQYRRELAGRQ